jgi:hypothetical protein
MVERTSHKTVTSTVHIQPDTRRGDSGRFKKRTNPKFDPALIRSAEDVSANERQTAACYFHQWMDAELKNGTFNKFFDGIQAGMLDAGFEFAELNGSEERYHFLTRHFQGLFRNSR